jgi:hypothetical protein
MEQYTALQKHIENYKNFQFNSGEKHEEIQKYISQLKNDIGSKTLD